MTKKKNCKEHLMAIVMVLMEMETNIDTGCNVSFKLILVA